MTGGKSMPRTLSTTLPEHECIRVVPLYQPQIQQAVAANLTYRGGALVEEAKVFAIFWGQNWADDGGSFIGSTVVTADAPKRSVSDSTIQTALQNWISNGTAPQNDKDTIYFVFLERGIVSVMGGSRSCQSYCGYHSNVDSIYYAVMPYPGCSGCLGGLTVLDALTATSSHELCEAITDPVPGTGWYDDTQGEIGDICAWQFKQVDGYTVQLEWSNEQNQCA
jgi:hypothetical protein